MWLYRSPIGPITIEYLPSDKAYGTIYNGTVWEACESPDISADNVYCHCTGCFDWDVLDGKIFDVPTDLSEWEEC